MNSDIKQNPHLIALVAYVALVPLVYFILDWVASVLPENKLLHVIVAVGLIVPIISYGVIPQASKYYMARMAGL